MRAVDQSPLSELREYIATFADRCTVARWFGALFHASVLGNLATDALKTQAQIVARGYSAQQADAEARKILDEVLEDGRVLPSEIARLKLARRLIARSERADAEITELAAT